MSRFEIRFEIGEEVIIKVREEIVGKGNITSANPFGRIYCVVLINNALYPNNSRILALDNRVCNNLCKYGWGSGSYQIYKLEEI